MYHFKKKCNSWQLGIPHNEHNVETQDYNLYQNLTPNDLATAKTTTKIKNLVLGVFNALGTQYIVCFMHSIKHILQTTTKISLTHTRNKE
jgi:hypothetical protein